MQSLHPYAAPRAAPERPLTGTQVTLVGGAVAGTTGGLVAGLLGGVPYWVAYGAPLKLAIAFSVFVLATGLLEGLATTAGVLFVRRVPLMGAMIGGTLGGVLPGAVGAAFFGMQQAPFMGTAAIAIAPFGGALVTSALVAAVERRSVLPDERGIRWPTFAGALVATIPFAIAGVLVCMRVDDARMLEELRAAAFAAASGREDRLVDGLLRVGALAGAALGLAVGAHVGLTVHLAQLSRVRSSSR